MRQITPMAAKNVNDYLINIILEKTKKNQAFDVLDIACGKGYNSFIISSKRKNARITAIDINENLLSFKNKQILFKKRNLNNGLNLQKKYDFIIATEIIEHLENPHFFIRDCLSHLKKGGYFLFSTPNIDNIYSMFRLLFQNKPIYFDLNEPSGHINPLHQITLKEILRRLKITNYLLTYNQNIFPMWFGNWKLIKLPGKNRLFGEINLIIVKKD